MFVPRLQNEVGNIETVTVRYRHGSNNVAQARQ